MDELKQVEEMVRNFHDLRRRSASTGRAYHRTLAAYFEERRTSHRKMEELPWHLEKLENWFQLKEILVDVEMFRLWCVNCLALVTEEGLLRMENQ